MIAIRRVLGSLTLLALGACTVPRPVAPPVNSGEALTPAALIAAVQSDVSRIDQSQDAGERSRLLASATANARQCLAQAPDEGACHYVQAQVLGLTARERPVQAVSLLKEMLTRLARAEALVPTFDHAGPARLSAVVLLRAPGWPLGPGDPDAAILAAQRATLRDPGYPPNLITLGQAQAKTDATTAARATFAKARVAIQAWPAASAEETAQRDVWQREVEQELKDLR